MGKWYRDWQAHVEALNLLGKCNEQIRSAYCTTNENAGVIIHYRATMG